MPIISAIFHVSVLCLFQNGFLDLVVTPSSEAYMPINTEKSQFRLLNFVEETQFIVHQPQLIVARLQISLARMGLIYPKNTVFLPKNALDHG